MFWLTGYLRDLIDLILSNLSWIYMIWFDLIWFDLIWFDLIWFDLIWFDLIWFDLIWFDLIWFDLIWFDLIWFGLVWFGLVWWISVTVQRNLVWFKFSNIYILTYWKACWLLNNMIWKVHGLQRWKGLKYEIL